ncbi:MAG: hypothetical protein K9M54_10255 [Kiritimatiellales bacterium]|nr:hypothetical protein [Kiritimatiellales bacterium]
MKHGGIDYHGALAPLKEACSLAHADILYVADLMRVGTTKDSVVRKSGIALRHLQFVLTVFSNRRRQGILVRDFSNIPLAFVFPFIRWMRSRMFFVVNHNLQWTIGNRAERAAFRCLGRWGCRFVFLEQVPVGLLEKYEINPTRSLALPHPVPESGFKRDRGGGVKTVGVIGQFRMEKGMDELLGALAPLAAHYRIVLAFPNLETFFAQSRLASAEWFELVDTSNHKNYIKAIAECDVVVLNHPSEGYEYRASGLIADAAAAHVPVVVRNLPVLNHQILQPVCIGECFDDPADIHNCIKRVSVKLAAGGYDFSTYGKERSAQGLADQLDRICNEK